ncbi:hypothetical protein J2Z69_001468 [Paenibacillus shirakamiensis]|uniref:Uncharacterized protein n=1 Tax=Paenibacillus shirakamiensis TaxID=1265935 RepID=A0ABS4JFG1_9BACL|nr:hypothetical protein [Paenibacillus shirakamiensis]
MYLYVISEPEVVRAGTEIHFETHPGEGLLN